MTATNDASSPTENGVQKRLAAVWGQIRSTVKYTFTQLGIDAVVLGCLASYGNMLYSDFIYDSHIRQGDNFRLSQNYAPALYQYQLAIDRCPQIPTPPNGLFNISNQNLINGPVFTIDKRRLISAKFKMASVEADLGRYTEAQADFAECMKEASQAFLKDDPIVLNGAFEGYGLQETMGQRLDAWKGFSQLCHAIDEARGTAKDPLSLDELAGNAFAAYGRLSALYPRNTEANARFVTADHALDIASKRYDELEKNHYNVVDDRVYLLLDKAGVDRLKLQPDQALEKYNQAQKIMDDNQFDTSRPSRIQFLLSKAEYFIETHDFNSAISTLDEAAKASLATNNSNDDLQVQRRYLVAYICRQAQLQKEQNSKGSSPADKRLQHNIDYTIAQFQGIQNKNFAPDGSKIEPLSAVELAMFDIDTFIYYLSRNKLDEANQALSSYKSHPVNNPDSKSAEMASILSSVKGGQAAPDLLSTLAGKTFDQFHLADLVDQSQEQLPVKSKWYQDSKLPEPILRGPAVESLANCLVYVHNSSGSDVYINAGTWVDLKPGKTVLARAGKVGEVVALSLKSSIDDKIRPTPLDVGPLHRPKYFLEWRDGTLVQILQNESQ